MLGTSPGAMFPHINEWEAISDYFRYQTLSAAAGDPSSRSDAKPIQKHLCPHLQSATA